jgi:hypothetical protein
LGTHHELVGRAGGIYAQLHRLRVESDERTPGLA